MENERRALDVEFDFDGDVITVKDYLRSLLQTLWCDKEGFDGKRPFGDSGWEHDLFTPLAEAGFIAEYDSPDWDEEEANEFVSCLIDEIFEGEE